MTRRSPTWLLIGLLCASSSSHAQDDEPTAAQPEDSPFTIEEDATAGVLVVSESGRPVLHYNFGDQLKDGIPADRTRSCYIHPLFGLDGEVLTDDFPTDHHHHRGLSLMWPRLKVGETDFDQWHIDGLRTVFHRFGERKLRSDKATIRIATRWRRDDGSDAAREWVTLVIHQAGESGRAIDVEHRIKVLDQPLRLLGAVDKGYGGFNLRFAERQETRITTDVGPQSEDSDHTRHRWADLSARFADREQTSGIAIFVRQDHPDFPPPWTLRHYGDLNVAWPGIEQRVLQPKEAVTLRYRLWIHRGDAGGVEAAYAGFIAEQGEK